MTLERLLEVLALQPGETVSELQKSSFTIPKWSDLLKQFDPMQHKIWDETEYPPKPNEKGQDDFKRTALGLQKLAVNRVAQSMFSTAVQRVYTYNKESESAQKAVDMLEEIYRTGNYIDSENVERAKKVNASCQMVTIWRTYEQENIIEDETSKFQLTHTTYSEMDGYKIFAQNDENGNLFVVSIFYTDASEVDHLEVYINTETPEYRKYDKGDDWVLNTEVSKPLEVFPLVYLSTKEPIWGGDAGTNLVEQLEEMESYQGMYIKRNALPTFTLDYGDITGSSQSVETEKSSDARRIIKVGKGGKMLDVTWAGADAAITSRYNRLRNAYFEQIQMPDTSFANMITSNTSAENKELIFADAKAKAKDLGGEWEMLFYKEMKIVIAFAIVMFPSMAKEFELITVRSSIVPYSVKSKKENAEYVAVGAGAMSTETQVRILGEVDNVAEEVDLIKGTNSAEVNQLQ